MPKGQRGIRGGLKPHLQDPYLSRKSYKEPTLCPRCGLVYRYRRWQRISDFDPGKAIERHKCPACRKEEDHYVMGIVYITGDFFEQRRDEIINMLKNEEKKEVSHNPLDRIMGIIEEKGGVRVETTSENLAAHLGRMLYHSYGGDVEYKFSDEQKLARVFWHREKKEVK
ncbi:MAG: ATPase [candidate division WOR-3 bacterium]|nr:MAG: ATPase [candidate division WOR-3 bacterium]